MKPLTTVNWLAIAREHPICDIGQISKSDMRALNKAAKRGEIAKWLAHWDTGSPLSGIGRLKTHFGPVEFVVNT